MIRILVCLTLALHYSCATVWAAEHTIYVVEMAWKPSVSFVQPGDSVKFLGMIGHNTEMIEMKTWAGAVGEKSRLGEESFSVIIKRERI